MCTEGPWSVLFGADQSDRRQRKEGKHDKHSSSGRDPSNFAPRSEEEVQDLIKQWANYAHPRAREFFQTDEMMFDVLAMLARGVDKNDDPILGPDDKPVYWYGDVTKEEGGMQAQAAIRMTKPGESAESITYVNRVLAFIFATDESFDQLMKLPKEPFKTTCGGQLNVNLAHIALKV
jgi:hypothetical protein